MARPDNARYLETHEWGRLEKDGTVTIGITDFAVDQLNDLTFVDLPEKGDKVTRGEAFGEIESVKAVSDLISPVSGKIVAVNDGVDGDDFSALKKDAFGAGWLIKVKPDNAKELDSAKSLADYEKQLAEEAH
ncbi:MAG: glycine cleavage system protein GcvH [Planctomycetes bacterium]|nr:glycine cleavage system protein GcvH [Planctomycetota bacterium]